MGMTTASSILLGTGEEDSFSYLIEMKSASAILMGMKTASAILMGMKSASAIIMGQQSAV